MKNKIIIIGSGFGGLSAAIHLAAKGYEVTIFEKNSKLGGKAGEIVEQGFRFDTGPTLLTMPFVLENLFNVGNFNINDFISIKSKDIVTKYFFNDGTNFYQYFNRDRLLLEFEKVCPNSSAEFIKFINYSKKIYDLTAELFLFQPFLEIKNILQLKSLKTLFKINRIDPFRTVHNANNAFFKDKKFVQLFDRFATYNGSNPFKAPATLNIIPFVEFEFGGYFVEGGIYRIINALEKIAQKLEVKIYKSSNVEKILVKNQKVEGILIDGEKFDAQIIISNSDLFNTYKLLIGDVKNSEANKYIKQELSTSAIIFYWGVSTNSENLEMDNILFSEDYQKEFHQLFDQKVVPNDPTIHIHISSKKNFLDAPKGFENWYVMINAPSINKQNFDIEEIRERVLQKIKKMTKIDLSNKIVFEKFKTPLMLEEETSGLYGSLYGPSHNRFYSAFLRQRNKSSVIDGLYFCGGTVHPGGGIPLAILSGKIVSEIVDKNLR